MENEAIVSKGGLPAAYTDKWEQRASIRTRPGKFIDFTISGAFSPEENQPIFLADVMNGMDNVSKNASGSGGVFASGSPRGHIRSGVADYQPRGVEKSNVEAEVARFLKKWKGAGGLTVQVAKDPAEAKS